MSKKITNNQHNDHEFVEIAGTKWATCNVGADKPTDTGLYFQWGDRKGYTADEVGKIKRFDWKHYKHYNGERLTKYTVLDNKQVLDLCDDAAFSYMGHGWRMPTQDDFRCLFESTTHRWTDNYQGSSVVGMVLTDITDNTKELFFPAAGFCVDGIMNPVYGIGNYWAMPLCSENMFYAHRLFFRFNYEYGYWNSYCDRRYGFPVRGILTV